MSDGPTISTILTTRESFEAIRKTTEYLRAQTARRQIELVIVCKNSGQLNLDQNAVADFHGHRVVELASMGSIAQANAAGVRAATAAVVALCEDHAFPDPKWAQSLIDAHQGPYAAVGPAVHNANPDTLVSRADFLVGYGPWAEPIETCEPHHLPGHNSSYKRDVLLGYEDRLEQMLEAETVMQWDLGQKGYRLYLEPRARLAHMNFALVGIWTRVQFLAGRTFGGSRAMGWPAWKRAFYTIASPLIPFVRLYRIWLGAARLEASQRSAAVFLTLLWGLALDGLGQMVGYALGPGSSSQHSYEFDRIAHVTQSDRARIAALQPQSS